MRKCGSERESKRECVCVRACVFGVFKKGEGETDRQTQLDRQPDRHSKTDSQTQTERQKESAFVRE